MSTVVVVLQDPQPSADVIGRLREVSNKTIGEIRQDLVAGRPFLIAQLFLNDHEERATELRDLVRVVSEVGVSAQAFEVEDDGAFPESLREDNRIELNQIYDLLSEWDKSLERIRDLDDKRAAETKH